MRRTAQKSISNYWPIALVVALFAVWLAGSLLLFGPFNRGNSDDGGKLGDSFGVLTSLFNGLAFAGLLITIQLQRRELRLQRRELSLQRQELVNTREVMRQQEGQLRASAEAAAKQLFESTFFSLLSMVQRFIEGLRLVHSQFSVDQGRDAFAAYVQKLFQHENGVIRGAISRERAAEIYRAWLPTYDQVFHPYVAMVLAVFDFIEASDRPNKQFYFELVRASLSPREKTLLFYHALAIREHTRLQGFIMQYALFRDIDLGTLTQHGKERGEWYFGSAYDSDAADFFRRPSSELLGEPRPATTQPTATDRT